MAVTYNAVVTYNLQVTLSEIKTVWIIVKASETTGLSDEDIFLDVCQVYGAFPITSFGEVEGKTFAHGSEGWNMFSGNPYIGFMGGRQTRFPDMTSANWGLDNTTNSNMGNIVPCTKFNYLDTLGIPEADHRFIQVNVPGVDIHRWGMEDTGVMWPGNVYFTGSSTKAVNIFNFPTQEPFFKEVMDSALQLGRFGTSMFPMAKLPLVTNVYTDGAPNADFPPAATPYPGATAALQANSGCPPSNHPPASSIIGLTDSYGRADNAGVEADHPGWSLIESYTFEVECIEIGPSADAAYPNWINSMNTFKATNGISDFDAAMTLLRSGATGSVTAGAGSLGPSGNMYPHAAYMNSLRAGLIVNGSKWRVIQTPLHAGGSAQINTLSLSDVLTTKEFSFGWGGQAALYRAAFWATMPTVGTKYPMTVQVIQYDECGGASGGAPPPARFTSAPSIASAGSATGAPSSSPVSPIAVPPTHSYPTTGGSILLLHSDTNPPTKPATPTPQDFFDKGKPASTSSTLNHAFIMDSLTDVVLTDNSINTIFYYLMDVAQNVQYIGEVTFYVDRNKPVGFITPPSGASWDVPYTYEWLGKNKMAPFDGRIEMSDLPGVNPITTWPYVLDAPAPAPIVPISTGKVYGMLIPGVQPGYSSFSWDLDTGIKGVILEDNITFSSSLARDGWQLSILLWDYVETAPGVYQFTPDTSTLVSLHVDLGMPSLAAGSYTSSTWPSGIAVKSGGPYAGNAQSFLDLFKSKNPSGIIEAGHPTQADGRPYAKFWCAPNLGVFPAQPPSP